LVPESGQKIAPRRIDQCRLFCIAQLLIDRLARCRFYAPPLDCGQMFQAQFQTFDDAASGEATATRVAALRAELKRRGLTGFMLPRADAHQNEYVPPAEERLAWLTGFTGSAGAAIVLLDRAVLFVDGRYTLQARDQIDRMLFEIAHLVETPPHQWIEKNLSAGMTLGYDPWLHTADGAEKLARACATVGAKLVPVDSDPVDAIWTDRPAPPLGKIVAHDLKFAGEDVAGKLFRIRDMIGKLRTDALVVSDPHNVACRSATRSFRRTAVRRSISTAASSTMRCVRGSRRLRTCRSPPVSSRGWKRSAVPRRMSGSIRERPPTRSRASSPPRAAPFRAGRIRFPR
jgi:hypothetical protein